MPEKELKEFLDEDKIKYVTVTDSTCSGSRNGSTLVLNTEKTPCDRGMPRKYRSRMAVISGRQT